MKKYIALYLILILELSFAQKLTISVIRNPAEAGKDYAKELSKTIYNINSIESADFNLCIGNITQNGKADEFRTTYDLLSSLSVKPGILIGQKDSWNDETAGTIIDELWENRNFTESKNGYTIIGLNSTVIWQRSGGHFSPETLKWLKDELINIPNSDNIIIITYHNFHNIDNWFKVTNLLEGRNVKLFISGEGDIYRYSPENKIKFSDVQNFFNAQDSTYGFSLLNIMNDTLRVERINNDRTNKNVFVTTLDGISDFSRIDSSNTYNYSTNIIWEKQLNTSLLTEPLVLNDKIIVADYSGYVQCFDLSGNILWDFDAFGNIISTPAAKDGWLVIATLQGDLHTLNLVTGEQIQSIGFGETITSDLLMIDYAGTKELMIPKQSGSKAAVVFSVSSGKTYCYDVETLQEYWVNNAPKGRVQIKPLLLGDKIIFGSMDGYVYSIDAREGWLIWKWRESKNRTFAPVDVNPVTDGKYIYLVTPLNHTLKIDALLGKTLWKTDKYDVLSSIGITNNKKRLLLKGVNGKFYNPSAKNGRGGLTYKINYKRDDLPLTTLESNGMYLFPTKEGNIYRIYKRKFKKLLFTGSAPMHNIKKINNGMFLSSNIDGHLVLFGYSEK